MTFETDHFSTYGIIGGDALAIAKTDILNQISDLYNSLDSNDYSKDNWNDVENAVDSAISDVTAATTEDEVNQAWTSFLLNLQQIPVRKSLGWLWILISVLVVLIALMIVCYLVWRVRYYDGDEIQRREFHFWRTKVLLWTWNKDDFVLEGWYHDPELTDRAENGFPMPWHGIKLYAKWNPIEILPEQEENKSDEQQSEAENESAEPAILLDESTQEESVTAEAETTDETPLLDSPDEEENAG